MPTATESQKTPETAASRIQKELLYLVKRELSPLANQYRYSDVPLESQIRWKPIVLFLGGYSSGKSTLINEFLGRTVQETGQSPTDDCFTVITAHDEGTTESVVERDGRVLLSSSEYPFRGLERHGERFASHFRLKFVPASPELGELCLIDTPGMLDSVTERDRGYDYQAVIGDLAQLADLILIFFDPHKAGTLRETYASLRETLPQKTFEDRLVFVLNRVDECSSLEDLIRVYGTLCWNLSQMTGRKDIPRILMTYANKKSESSIGKPFLGMLSNQREQLHQLIISAPRRRLDHLASFVEFHTARMSYLVNTLQAIRMRERALSIRLGLVGICTVLIATGIAFYLSDASFLDGGYNAWFAAFALGSVAGVAAVLWWALLKQVRMLWLRSVARRGPEEHEEHLLSQYERDIAQSVRGALQNLLNVPSRIPNLRTLSRHQLLLARLGEQQTKELRHAIHAMHREKG